jgi:uroporphyrinogen-III synthase
VPTPHATSLPDGERPGVLLTRPESGAARTAATLRDMGFCPVMAPALQIRALPALLPDPARIQAVLVTSANALPALTAAWRHRPVFAVGTSTATQARANGFSTVHNADADADALAKLVARQCRPTDGTLLLLSGKGQGATLASTLRTAGFRVLRRAVYEAVAVPELPAPARAALAEGRIAHALFFSAETAQAFLRQVRRAGLVESLCRIEAISIGQAARVALEAVPWRCIRIAERPTQDAMLACLR